MTVERATRNVGWVFGLYLVRRVIRLGYLAVFARLLHEQGFGDYYFLLTLIGMLSIFSGVSLNTFLIRRINRDPSESSLFISRCFGFSLLSSMLFAVGMIVAALVGDFEPQLRLGMIIMGCAVVPIALIMLSHATGTAHEKLWIYAVLDNATPIVEAAVGLALLLNGFGLVAICTLHLVMRLLYAGVFFLMTRRYVVRFSFAFSIRAWVSYLRESVKIAASSMQMVVYRQLPVIILRGMTSAEQVGFFGAAMTLIQVVRSAGTAFRSSVFPYMVRAWERSPDELRSFQESCVRMLGVVAVPIGLLGIILARPVILLIFGDRFECAASVLQVLSWYVFPLIFEQIMVRVCFASGHHLLPAVGQAVTNGLRIALTVALILSFGERAAEGLAWAMLVSGVLCFVIYTVLIRRYIYKFAPFGPLARIAAACVVPVTMGVLLPQFVSPWFLWVLGPLSVAVFALGVLVFRVFTAREFKIIRRAMRSFTGGRAVDEITNDDAPQP